MAFLRLPGRSQVCDRRLVVSFLFFLLFFTTLACNERVQEGRGLLPSAPADQTNSAVPAPSPFDQTPDKAAFARTVLHTAGPANVDVTVRDMIVGPHGEAQLPAFDGSVLIDTKSGMGTASAGGKTVDLSTESPASFAAGAGIALKNSGDSPLVLRLYLLEGK